MEKPVSNITGRVASEKPCPFCDSSNLWVGYCSPYHQVKCVDCGATQDGTAKDDQQAIEQWNKRT